MPLHPSLFCDFNPNFCCEVQRLSYYSSQISFQLVFNLLHIYIEASLMLIIFILFFFLILLFICSWTVSVAIITWCLVRKWKFHAGGEMQVHCFAVFLQQSANQIFIEKTLKMHIKRLCVYIKLFLYFKLLQMLHAWQLGQVTLQILRKKRKK